MAVTKMCTACGNSKIIEKDFINNPNTSDGKDLWCNNCRKKKVNTENELNDYCRENNRPYNEPLFKKCYQESIHKVNNKNKSMSIKDIDKEIIKVAINSYFRQMNFKNNNIGVMLGKYEFNIDKNSLSNKIITQDMILKWGKWDSENDYLILEDFCSRMKDFNTIETPQDEFYLKKLAVISLKMDKELEGGNYGAVKNLGDLFSKYMGDSKFRASDKTDASKTGGIRTFSQVYAEIEKDGFIPPWESYRKIKGLKQDIVDKTIMYILNYTLKLNQFAQMIEPPEDTPKLGDDADDS